MGKSKDQVIIPVSEPLSLMPEGYKAFIADIKEFILIERLKTVISANSAMIMLYWDIGKLILDRQKSEGCGTKVIDQISFDLKENFPEISGFSSRNLKYIKNLLKLGLIMKLCNAPLHYIT